MSEPRSSDVWDGSALDIDGRASYQLQADLDRYVELAQGADWFVEVGTGEGGTGAYVAQGTGCKVLSVDLLESADVVGDAADPKTFAGAWARVDGSCMVLLDADVYHQGHVLRCLRTWPLLVTKGQHLVVCKTHRGDWGAKQAVELWNPSRNGFDPVEEPSPTLNPGGYWKRG